MDHKISVPANGSWYMNYCFKTVSQEELNLQNIFHQQPQQLLICYLDLLLFS